MLITGHHHTFSRVMISITIFIIHTIKTQLTRIDSQLMIRKIIFLIKHAIFTNILLNILQGNGESVMQKRV